VVASSPSLQTERTGTDQVAVKKFIGALNAQGIKEFRAEAQLLHGVGNHPNIIFLFGACTAGPNYCLVLPYYKRGSVRDYFKAMPEEKRTWGFVRSISLQIVAGSAAPASLHCPPLLFLPLLFLRIDKLHLLALHIHFLRAPQA
jgi:serine/threonine protein kinase